VGYFPGKLASAATQADLTYLGSREGLEIVRFTGP